MQDALTESAEKRTSTREVDGQQFYDYDVLGPVRALDVTRSAHTRMHGMPASKPQAPCSMQLHGLPNQPAQAARDNTKASSCAVRMRQLIRIS